MRSKKPFQTTKGYNSLYVLCLIAFKYYVVNAKNNLI